MTVPDGHNLSLEILRTGFGSWYHHYAPTDNALPAPVGHQNSVSQHVLDALSVFHCTLYYDFAGTWDIMCSDRAVMVRLGLTPRLAGTTDPSAT